MKVKNQYLKILEYLHLSFNGEQCWLGNGPEDVSKHIKCKVDWSRKMCTSNRDDALDLKAAIKATWASITPEQCHKLIAFMPRHIDAVIHAKGGPTKYWEHRNEHTFQKPDISV